MNITTNEAIVLNALAYAEHNRINGARPDNHNEVNTWLWVDDFPGLDAAQGKGVVASLVKKELIVVTDQSPDPDNSVTFTIRGYQEWVKIDDNRTGEKPV